MMRGQIDSCGARTRTGLPCKSIPMRNGRCRMHGGRSTGPNCLEKLLGNQNAKGNKSKLVTGEYERITLDTLTPDEIAAIRYEASCHGNVELILGEIRIRRMIQRENELMDMNKPDMDALIRLSTAQVNVLIRQSKILIDQINNLPWMKQNNVRFEKYSSRWFQI